MHEFSIRHGDIGHTRTGDEEPVRHPRKVAMTGFEGGCAVLSLDVERLADPRIDLEETDRRDPVWSAIRRTLEIFPSPRHGNRRSILAGLVRQEIERHGLELLEGSGVVRVVDRRIEDQLVMIPAGSGHVDDVFEFDTGWSAPRRHDGHVARTSPVSRLGWILMLGSVAILTLLVLTRFESILILLALARMEPILASTGILAAGTLPFVRRSRSSGSRESRPTPAFGSERVRVGRGWIETGSGRRRRSEQVLTTVMRESEADDRIEVRIISANRVIRMRFESATDHRFVEFWRRWAGYRTDASSSLAG